MKIVVFWLKVCSSGFNWQYAIIGSDDGLVPIRWQAIICTNDGLVYWRIYVSLGVDELNPTLFSQ